jgi:hypothetical protein
MSIPAYPTEYNYSCLSSLEIENIENVREEQRQKMSRLSRLDAQRNSKFLLEHKNAYWNMAHRVSGEKADKVQWNDAANQVKTFVPDWLERFQMGQPLLSEMPLYKKFLLHEDQRNNVAEFEPVELAELSSYQANKRKLISEGKQSRSKKKKPNILHVIGNANSRLFACV